VKKYENRYSVIQRNWVEKKMDDCATAAAATTTTAVGRVETLCN
jgi:hypothetical protein